MSEKQGVPPKAGVEQLREVGQAMIDVAQVLERLPDDASRQRVLRAAAILLGIELHHREYDSY